MFSFSRNLSRKFAPAVECYMGLCGVRLSASVLLCVVLSAAVQSVWLTGSGADRASTTWTCMPAGPLSGQQKLAHCSILFNCCVHA